MQNLIRVGVADSAEDARVGERAFERMVRGAQHSVKDAERNLERLVADRIRRAIEHVDLLQILRSRFGETERAAIEPERGQWLPLAVPVQTSPDHQVNREPQIPI